MTTETTITIDGWRCRPDPDNEGTVLMSRRGRIVRYRMSDQGHLLPVDRSGAFVRGGQYQVNTVPPHIVDRLDNAWRKLCGSPREY